jgi:lysozyme
LDWAGAALELLKWVYGGGRVLPGLVARRQAEIALMSQSI